MKNILYYVIVAAFVGMFFIGRATKHCDTITPATIIYTDSVQLDYLKNNIDSLVVVTDSLKLAVVSEKQKRINTQKYYEKIINDIDTISQPELRLFFTDRYN